MPKFFKIIITFIAGYAFMLGLLALITSNSKCNILSSASCGTLDAIYMVMLTPLVIPTVMFENKKEEQRISKLQEERRAGVLKGDRESIESCLNNGCFLGPPIDDPHPLETEKYKKLSAQKLIAFDHLGSPPLEDRQQEYMMMAYWKLSETENVSSENYQKYINRAWQLLVEYNNNNEFKLNNDHELIIGVGGSAFLLRHELFTKEFSDKTVQNAFDGCMFDSFWKQAKYENADTEIFHSCQDALAEYLYRQQLDHNLAKKFKDKWQVQWDQALQARHRS